MTTTIASAALSFRFFQSPYARESTTAPQDPPQDDLDIEDPEETER